MRVTHLPTGIVVECQDDRSQHKNKDRALKVLAARIKDKQSHEQQAKEAATRKSLIGSGDRSERIRTYNFPQGRLTDHRINLTLYRLDAIMDGDLDELIRRARQRTSGGAACFASATRIKAPMTTERAGPIATRRPRAAALLRASPLPPLEARDFAHACARLAPYAVDHGARTQALRQRVC